MNSRQLPALIAAGLFAVLSGCCLCDLGVRDEAPAAAAAETYVVVVPGRNGHIGGVVVNSGGKDQIVLDTAYAAAHVDRAGKMERAPSPPPEEIMKNFAEVAQAKPEPPVSYTLYFDTAGDEPTEESIPMLKQIYAEIARRQNAEVTVIGHTDRVGKVEHNDELSARRAQHVRDYLIKHGVPADAIGTAGRGEREPLVPTDDEVAEPKNRRVEINIR